jgi:hypothetical protein
VPASRAALCAAISFVTATAAAFLRLAVPGVAAAPSTSLFQSHLLAIRVRAEAAWAAAPGAVQVINGVDW